MANREKHLRYAEAYFLMEQESYLLPLAMRGGVFERRMWLELFKWAGWRDK